LSFLASIVLYAPEQLLALLSARGGSNNEKKLPWVSVIIADLDVFWEFHKTRVHNLGPPRLYPDNWLRFIREYPGQWKALVKMIVIYSMGLDYVAGPKRQHVPLGVAPVDTHKCSICDYVAENVRALGSHIRAKHKKLDSLTDFLGNSSRCPVCCVDFASRTRLVAHITDKRVRGKKPITCRQVLAAGLVTPISHDELTAARMHDRSDRRAAFKRGHSQPLAAGLTKRKLGTIVPDITVSVQNGRRLFSQMAADDPPSNMFDWSTVKPTKRLRCKAPLDLVLSHAIDVLERVAMA